MTDWPKRVVEWTEGDTAFVSVPFTWLLPEAWSRCVALKAEGKRVRVGGPAVSLIKFYPKALPDFSQVAEVGGEIDALPHHNPDATFTSRGCIRRCPFCAVWRIEGDLRELPSWTPRPIVCDNNLLACSRAHFDKVIDSLKPLSGIDFNQGLDARLLTDYHACRLAELDLDCVRFAWDNMASEDAVHDTIQKVLRAGFPRSKINVYVLLGHDDTPDDALYRLQTIKDAGMTPYPMRYQPLDTLQKDSYVGPHWTDHELHRFMRYWSRLFEFRPIPFEEYEVTHKAEPDPLQLTLEAVPRGEG